MESSREPNHLEGEGLSPVIKLIPKGDGQIDLPEWHGLLPGHDAVERRSGWAEACRSTPISSSVFAYMMLRPLPPSMSTLVSHFGLTIRSTTSGYLPRCGTVSGWSVQLKVMVDSDHRSKGGVAGCAV